VDIARRLRRLYDIEAAALAAAHAQLGLPVHRSPRLSSRSTLVVTLILLVWSGGRVTVAQRDKIAVPGGGELHAYAPGGGWRRSMLCCAVALGSVVSVIDPAHYLHGHRHMIATEQV
jgi:hypothetical protein